MRSRRSKKQQKIAMIRSDQMQLSEVKYEGPSFSDAIFTVYGGDRRARRGQSCGSSMEMVVKHFCPTSGDLSNILGFVQHLNIFKNQGYPRGEGREKRGRRTGNSHKITEKYDGICQNFKNFACGGPFFFQKTCLKMFCPTLRFFRTISMLREIVLFSEWSIPFSYAAAAQILFGTVGVFPSIRIKVDIHPNSSTPTHLCRISRCLGNSTEGPL